MIVQFATQSYKLPSRPVSAQQCINAYSERQPADAKSQVSVLGAPGLTLFASCGNGPIRGVHTLGGVLYAVSGGVLYRVDSNGTTTPVGATISGKGRVSMSDNGTQLCIVNGSTGYIYTTASGLQAITSVNFFSANTVTFFDNYFVFDRINTNQFFISGILDGTSFSGTDFASAEVQPDFVIATVNQQENLLIFGEKSIETWYDSGALSFPFQRYDGATIERGCVAPLTAIKEDNSVFFLGDDLIFYRLNGIVPVRVSTHAIESEWTKYSVVSDAHCFSYTYEGHKFVVLTFPTTLHTWVYDISTGLWHERESWDQNNQTMGRWRGNCGIQVYGKNLIGDAINGNIGMIDPTVFTEYGNTIRQLLASPPIHSDRKRIFISAFELDMETGIGRRGQAGPLAMLDWSQDGGRTFSQLQIWDSMGKQGEYLTRLRWLRLGQSRQWIFRLHITDPARRSVISAHADFSVGM